ncbi:hypothetical protein EIP91_005084 [Steccherinum ochraceum]|uniref:Uncharacterized protein n=1 Tax=Steccherinum ochraceum TaxID=92696 RepID=A0A4R0RAP6_9APHY|nr:hypothetical protein EIP91_005084 [Steccherinum ochraceum]
MSDVRPVFVVVGVGSGGGTGAATARLFAKEGYSVALIARSLDRVTKLEDEIKLAGGQAHGFPVSSYSYSDVTKVFQQIKQHSWPSNPKAEIRAALWNASGENWGHFLNITEEKINDTVQSDIIGPFAFSREAILAFQANTIDSLGRRGTLLFTGATASLRGNVTTSAFAAGKFAVRALSQSLAKEFGKQNIHVAQVIIDGGILTDYGTERRPAGEAPEAYITNEDVRLDPNSIAKTYLYLTNQDRSAWTWELDLRPAHEKW